MMQRTQKMLIGAVALVAVSIPTALAIANSVGGQGYPEGVQSSLDAVTKAEEQAAIQELCGGRVACTIVNGYADPTASESGARTTLGAMLAESGKPADGCGETAAIYKSAGLDVDAFVGPCPTVEEAEAAVVAAGGNLAPAAEIEPPRSR